MNSLKRLVRRAATALLAVPLWAFAAADPQIAIFNDNPTSLPAGGLYAYELEVDNNDVDTATNVVVNVSVASGAQFVSATPSANCTPVSSLVVNCSLGSVAGGGADRRIFQLVFRALGPGAGTINATATLTADSDANPGNNVANQNTSVTEGADLSLGINDAPDPVVGGGTVTYTLTVTNQGPSVSQGVSLSLPTPANTSTPTVVSAVGWSCTTGATTTCTHPGPIAVLGSLAAVQLRYTVTAGSGTLTAVATVAPAVGGTADPDNANNTATANTTVNAGADLRMASKSITSGTPVVAGSTVTFRLQPRNLGPSAASDVTVTDVLPAGWSFQSGTWAGGGSCSAAGQTVSCTRTTLAVGATDDITLQVTAPAVAGTYSNSASIAAASPSDPVAGNNSATLNNIQVLLDGADLALTKTKTPNPVAQGSNLVSTLTVTNRGPRAATGPLKVVEVLAGETYVSASGTGWACVPTGSVVECTHANGAGLAVNASLPALLVTTTATGSGTLTNNACTGSSLPAGAGAATASPPLEGDPNAANDCASASVTSTTVVPDLSITKTTSTPSGGDKVVSTTENSVTYTLLVTNASAAPQAATGVRITDTVPGFINGRTSISVAAPVVAGTGNALFSCSTATATVTCTQGSGSFATGDTVTIAITVTRAMSDGTFTNTAVVSNTAEGDPNSANNSASDTVTIEPIADVQMVSKTVSPGTVRAGEQSTYVLSYRNNGPSTATGVVVTDTFTFPVGDSGVTVVSIASSRAGSTCSIAAGAVLNPGANSYTCTIGSLANNQAETITLVVRPNFQAGNGARSFNNTAAITTTSVENPAGGDNGNNSQAAVLNVSASQVDLLVNQVDLVDPVPYQVAGTYLHYRVRVQNNGPSFATNVTVAEQITPPIGKQVRFVCDTTTYGGSTCNAVSLCSVTGADSGVGAPLNFSCQVPAGNATTGLAQGELAVGQFKDYFLRFQVLNQPEPSGDTFNHQTTVSANEPDSQPASNAQTEATTTRQRVDLQISKTASAGPVSINQPFNWTVTVVNNGPGDSLQTDITDTLPAGAQVTGPITWSATNPVGNGTCTQAGQTITCATGRLNNGGTTTITIPARFTSWPVAGSATNTASIDVSPAKLGGVIDPPGPRSANHLINVTKSSLAGLVFEDRVRDGANAGTPQSALQEPRIAGVSVRLTGTDAYGNTIDITTTSGADGTYLFDNLPPSNGTGYTLTETLPAGYQNCAQPPPMGSLGGNYDCGALFGPSIYGNVVVPANTTGTGYDFPELRRVSLSGFVYIDTNANGVRDAGVDTPIAGATVRLLDAFNLATVLATTTTDAAGAYSFTNLNPLVWYAVEQPLPSSPAGLVNGVMNLGLINGVSCAGTCQPESTGPNTDLIRYIDLTTGVDGTQFNFGELAVATIAGTVYVDRNRDDSLQATPADGRIAGVTLRLVQGADCGSGTVLQTTTTDAAGNYGFAAVTAGAAYLVCQTQPTGYAQGVANPGAGGAAVGSDAIRIASLPSGGSANNHFGERVASIAGVVYLDANHDGAKAPAEAGIAGVTITLSGTDAAANTVNRSTTTDGAGTYRFDDLLAAGPGGYVLTQQLAQPVVVVGAANVATLNGRTTAGSTGGTASGLASLPSSISAIALAAGADSVNHLFGEILPVAISGTVFVDLNNNGAQNLPGDSGLGSVTINLTGIDDTGAAVSRTLSTAPDGSFAVADLRPGTYTLTEPTQPPGTSNGFTVPGTAGGTATLPATLPSAISTIVLTTPGASSSGNLFAELASSSSLSGKVWLDTNANGLSDGTEAGIAGITLNLSGTDAAGNAVTRTTTTDAAGNYAFTGLSPGTYTVAEPDQPVGTVNSITRAGSLGGTATPVQTVPSAISAVVLGVGQSSTGNDFYELPGASIAGRVFLDANDNGLFDGGESPLPGVLVELIGSDDLGQAVLLGVFTAADGSYQINVLRPGTYTVREPTQPLGTVNGQTRAGSAGGTATPVATLPSAISAVVLTAGAQATAYDFAEVAQSPDLRVSKSHTPTRLTVGHTAQYLLQVRNAGELPSSGEMVLSDRLPTGLTLAATPTGTGWVCVGAVGAASFTCRSSTVLAVGATHPGVISATVQVGAAAQAASPVNNVVLIEGGGEISLRGPTQGERDAFNGNPPALPLCVPAISHNACRDAAEVQLAASVSGTVWSDVGSSLKVLDAGDRRLPGWLVEVVDVANGNQVVGRQTTATDGSWRIDNLTPGVELAVRFREPGSNVVFGYPVNGELSPGSSGASCDAQAATQGRASSCVAVGTAPQLTVVLAPGQNLPQQSLPVDPSGVVYDSVIRQALPGAVVSLSPVGACAGWDPAAHIVGAGLGGYTVVGSSIAMTVGADGLYQFFFSTNSPATCTFALNVVPPAGYGFPSSRIPPQAGVLSPPGGPTVTHRVQPQATAPTAAVGTGTQYWLQLTGGSSGTGIIHNHIPLDPATPTVLMLSKTGDRTRAEVGDTVRYTLTVRLSAGPRPAQVSVVDRLPAGFTYISGTAMLGNVALANPVGAPGPALAFNMGAMPASGLLVLQYRARVGVGAQQGDGINRARAHACGAANTCVSGSGGAGGFTPLPGSVPTNEGQHRVVVDGGVFGTSACVAGKVFVDCNRNHVQDREELGIPGVRLLLQDGTSLISDVEGKYSYCGLPPKSHVLKVDGLTLPRGSRLTTSSNRNLGDAQSLWLDLKAGELHRADFVEGSCSNTVLEQVKARRAQGEVRAPETEKKGGPALRFDSKAHQLDTLRSPQQGTDGANQQAPKPRAGTGSENKSSDENNKPTPTLPMNQPPPSGRTPADAPAATSTGGANGQR